MYQDHIGYGEDSCIIMGSAFNLYSLLLGSPVCQYPKGAILLYSLYFCSFASSHLKLLTGSWKLQL